IKMAKAKTKLARPKQVKPKGIVAKYERENIPAVYANFANISSTMREVFIDFCVVAPPYEVDEKEQIQAPVVVRILANREFAHALNEAIKTRLDIMKSQEPLVAQVKAK